MNIYEQIKHNSHLSWFLVAGFVIFFLIIGIGIDYYYGAGIKTPIFTILAVGIAAVCSYSGHMYGDRLILRSTNARPLDINDIKEQQWFNVAEEMSIAAGLAPPKTFIIDDKDPNAFATGRNPAHSSIVVTKGLLEVLSRDELQAICAHEMSHIKNYDIRVMLLIAVLVGSVALLSDWTARFLFRGGRRNSKGSGRGQGGAALLVLIIWLIAVILAPLLSHIMAMAVSRRREYLADAQGAELTRNPIALANALEKMEAMVEPTRSINNGTAHLCIVDPKGKPLNSKEGWRADLFATHPPIRKRIEALKQMAYAK